MRRPPPVFTEDALRQLQRLSVRRQRTLVNAIRLHLGREDPRSETRNKFRLKRASSFADYELRVEDMRAFYRVDEDGRAVIGLIGTKKGSRLMVGGREFKL